MCLTPNVDAYAGGMGVSGTSAEFPIQRPRRLRRTAALRDLVAEHRVATTDLIAPLFVREAIDAPIEIHSLPGVYQDTRESLRKGVVELAELGVKAVMLFGIPAVKDDVGSGAFDPDGIVQLALARSACRARRLGRVDGRSVRRRVHQSWPLRDRRRQRRGRQRRHARDLRQGRHRPSRRRRRCGGAERDDGRSGGGDPRRARRRRASRRGDSRLLGQVRQRPVRPVPRRGRRHDRRRWRPQGVPAGLAQRPRGVARGAGRHRPGRRHGDGQAGAGLPRRDQRRAPGGRRAARRLSRQRRVLDDQGRRRQRMDRSRRGGARAPHGDQAGRCRHDPHLPDALVCRDLRRSSGTPP